MKLIVQESKKVDDGKYTGTIIELIERNKPYKYIDFVIEEKLTKMKLKYGLPNYLSPESKLGRFLEILGGKIIVGKEIDPEVIAVGCEVQFMVQNINRGNENYANIIPYTVKLNDGNHGNKLI